jgi:hypothetical protein
MKVSGMFLAAALVVSPSGLAFGQTTTDLNNEVARMDTLAASQGNTKVINKISGEFSSFLGSDATAVVTGLRNGTPITLTSTTLTPSSTPGAPPVPTTTTTTIYPTTGKMGFGNVTTALALAKHQLSTMGITNPTPEQLQAALTGGTITMTSGTGATATTTTYDLQGILTMRSQYKMGWGKIAQSLDVKLGALMSSLKSAKQSLTTTSTSSSASQATSPSGSGIVSGSGKSQGNSGQGASGKGNSGQGIVSASGKSVGNAYGKGIVSGSGQVDGGSSAVTSAGGAGNSGQAKGQNK